MQNHKNDLNPGPLTVSGFSGGSCCQAILPRTSRTPLVPAAKGQIRLTVPPVSGFKAWNDLLPGDLLRGRPDESGGKFAGNPGMLNSDPERLLPVFAEFLVMALFRKRTGELLNRAMPENTGLNTSLANPDANVGTAGICYCKICKPACRTVFNHLAMMSEQHCIDKLRCKTSFRWRTTRQSDRLDVFVTGQDYPDGFSIEQLQQIDLQLILN